MLSLSYPREEEPQRLCVFVDCKTKSLFIPISWSMSCFSNLGVFDTTSRILIPSIRYGNQELCCSIPLRSRSTGSQWRARTRLSYLFVPMLTAQLVHYGPINTFFLGYYACEQGLRRGRISGCSASIVIGRSRCRSHKANQCYRYAGPIVLQALLGSWHPRWRACYTASCSVFVFGAFYGK